MIPELDLARINRWIKQRNDDLPPSALDQVHYETDIAGHTITVIERRPPWDGIGDDTRFAICRLRYTAKHNHWTLYWRDRHEKFHRSSDTPNTPHIEDLLDHVADDPTGIFWG